MILISIILEGSPRSIVSHSALISDFVFSIRLSNIANSNRLLTQTITTTNLSPLCLIYVHGSVRRHLKLCLHIT